MPHQSKSTARALALLFLWTAATFSTAISSSSPLLTTRTIRVCSGVDCRVDGSAQCLRLLQEELRQRKRATTTTRTITITTAAAAAAAAVTIKSVPCIGPCGDGPNVVVVDETTGKRIVDPDLAQQRKEEGPMSLVPADMFGVNTAGVYQVRNAAMANAVMNLALASTGTASTATTTPGGGSGGGGSGGGTALLSEPPVRGQSENSGGGIVVSSRKWWDRPRKERIFLQRCMHASILVGIADHYGTTAGTSSSGEAQLDAWGWSMAAFLWLLSNFIMKESLLEQVLTGKARTNHRKKRR